MMVTAVALAACTTENRVMEGGPDGVIINYYGDVTATERLARQHCARFERLPIYRGSKDNNAYYTCLQPNRTHGPSS